MYEELDFRLALTHSHLEKVKRQPAKNYSRKGITEYLQGSSCDIFKLLDEKYWVLKNGDLPNENVLDITFEENREVIAGSFREQEYHPFIWLTNLETEEDDEKHVVPGLFWHNSEDDAHPYASGLTN